MNLEKFQPLFPWAHYTKSFTAKLEKLRSAGHFTEEESDARDMRLVTGQDGDIEDGNFIKLFLLVDKDDGIIVDAKFQAFGQTALLVAAEIACELMIGKNYDQAKRISFSLIEHEVKDKNDSIPFPPETLPHVNLVLNAIQNATEQCTDLPLPSTYVSIPAPHLTSEGKLYPGWDELSTPQKIAVIEEVLNEHIRPYIALDAGGVEVLNLLNGYELIIAYQGSCTSCYSSVGTTLSYIQQTLRSHIHPQIQVTPDLQSFQG